MHRVLVFRSHVAPAPPAAAATAGRTTPQPCNALGPATLKTHCADGLHKSIPTFEDVTDYFYNEITGAKRAQALAEVRAVVESHGLNDTVSIDLKHRHDDMPPSQRLVETVDLDGRTSTMRPEEVRDAVPFSFTWRGGEWLPFEFVKNSPAAREGLGVVAANGAFLTELAAVLAKHRMLDVLGLHILHRDHLMGKRGTLETPGNVAGELLLRPYDEALYEEMQAKERANKHDKVVRVGWNWSQKSNPLKLGGFCGSCCSHCNHCGSHCNGHHK